MRALIVGGLDRVGGRDTFESHLSEVQGYSGNGLSIPSFHSDHMQQQSDYLPLASRCYVGLKFIIGSIECHSTYLHTSY